MDLESRQPPEPLAERLRGLAAGARALDLDAPASLIPLVDLSRGPIQLAESDWDAAKGSFTLGDTVLLVQVLVVLEREFHWPGGAASGAGVILGELRRREPEVAALLADWVAHHTEDEYLPFGHGPGRREWLHSRTPCLNLREARVRAVRERQRPAPPPAIAPRERSLQAYTLAREAEQAKLDFIGARVRAEAPDRTPAGRLRYVAFDTRHEISFFPKEWARVSDVELAELDAQTLAALTARLETATAVSWHRLYKRLLRLGRPASL